MKAPTSIWVEPKKFYLPGGKRAKGFSKRINPRSWKKDIAGELKRDKFFGTSAIDYIEAEWLNSDGDVIKRSRYTH